MLSRWSVAGDDNLSGTDIFSDSKCASHESTTIRIVYTSISLVIMPHYFHHFRDAWKFRLCRAGRASYG